MPIIRVGGGPPDCPLCLKKMREVYYGAKSGPHKKDAHKFYICTEELCMISVNANDPCITKWSMLNSADQAPKCQLCKKPMRVFVRKDKLVIMQCRDKSHHMYQIARGDARALPPISQ